MNFSDYISENTATPDMTALQKMAQHHRDEAARHATLHAKKKEAGNPDHVYHKTSHENHRIIASQLEDAHRSMQGHQNHVKRTGVK